MGIQFIVNVLTWLGFDVPGAPAQDEVEQQSAAMAAPGVARRSTRRVRLDVDVWLLSFTIILLVFGLLMVYSASADFSFQVTQDETASFRRQLLWVALGVIVATILTFFRYQNLQRYVLLGGLGTLLLLVYVVIAGTERFGAQRSLFSGSYQPSELAKLMVIIYLSVWLYNHRQDLHSFSLGLFPVGAILGIVGGLIALQPDVSATLTIFILGGMLFFMGGGGLRSIGFLGAVTLLAFILLLLLVPTGQQRLEAYTAGMNDLLQSSDHVQRAMEAFVSGGLTGVGIGKGQIKLLGLPFPHTDSIYAVIGEETGLIGAVAVLLLFMGILWRGLHIAQKAPDGLGRLLAGGLTMWIVFEAMLNMAVIIGLLPFAGNALPFISFGGSSMLFSLAAIGILLSISRQAEQKQTTEERTFNAVVDLRGRDRRRSVSGAVNPAGTRTRRL